MIKAIFVDTSALVALINKNDSNHAPAKAALDQLLTQNTVLVISNYIRAETHALLLSKAGRDIALKFLESSSFYLEWVSREDESEAIAMIRGYADKHFSLTDCTSFVIMKRLGINAAFAYDRHFTQLGWKVVR